MKILLIIFLSIIVSCGRLPNISIDIPQKIIIKPEQESKITINVLTLTVTQTNKDVNLSWNEIKGVKNYIIHRAWSYPQNETSYHKIGETNKTNFTIENAYWSGIHYYMIEYNNSFSDYILYCPK